MKLGRPGIGKDTCRASRQLHLAMATSSEKRAPLGQVFGDWLRSLLWLKRFCRWVIFRRA